MRKKSSEALIGVLIVLGGAVWFFEKIGWGWLLAIVIIVVVGWVALTFSKERRPGVPHDEFGPIFNTPQEASAYYRTLMKANPKKSMRLRSQQILRESLQIALSSKKRDTAESRMELAEKIFGELQTEHSVPSAEWKRIRERFLRDQEEFSTVKYTNQARGFLERGGKLKTEKGRKKYVDMAKAAIEEGLSDPSSNKEQLTEFLRNIEGAVPSPRLPKTETS